MVGVPGTGWWTKSLASGEVTCSEACEVEQFLIPTQYIRRTPLVSITVQSGWGPEWQEMKLDIHAGVRFKGLLCHLNKKEPCSNGKSLLKHRKQGRDRITFPLWSAKVAIKPWADCMESREDGRCSRLGVCLYHKGPCCLLPLPLSSAYTGEQTENTQRLTHDH